jgi:capsular exopolysaccharide synthesis family protein
MHPDEETALTRYLGVLRRRVWIVVGGIVAGIVLAVLYTSTQDAQFVATAKVFLSRNAPAAAVSGQPDPNFSYGQTERVTATQAEIAGSLEVARMVQQRTGMKASPDELLRQVIITPDGAADVLNVQATSLDRSTALQLARGFAGQFVALRARLDAQPYASARRRVEAERDRLQEDSPELAARLEADANELLRLESLQSASAYLVTASDVATQVAPRPKRNLAVGFILGLLAGVGAAFALEALDTRVRSTRDVETLLGAPWVGYVPNLRRERLPSTLVVRDKPATPEAETFRSLRTGVELAAFDLGIKVVMVTSSLADEGKTTVAANLAMSFAEAGRDVALVDLDLRHPTLHQLTGQDREPGLTDVLAGRSTLEEALVTVLAVGPEHQPPRTLQLLPAGTPIHGSVSLLSSGGLGDIISDLDKRADMVVIDAPPALGLSDVGTISSVVESVLLVVNLRSVRRRHLRLLRRNMKLWDARVLGVAVVGDPEAPSATYGYYGPTAGASPDDVPATRELVRDARA